MKKKRKKKTLWYNKIDDPNFDFAYEMVVIFADDGQLLGF